MLKNALSSLPPRAKNSLDRKMTTCLRYWNSVNWGKEMREVIRERDWWVFVDEARVQRRGLKMPKVIMNEAASHGGRGGWDQSWPDPEEEQRKRKGM